MKSERRHELETNTLADALSRAPLYFQQYGSRILLGLVLVILVIVFLVQRSANRRAEAQAAVENLAVARELIEQLRTFAPLRVAAPEQRRDLFKQLVTEADRALGNVRETGREPGVLAEALVARGDLAWAQAAYPQELQPVATPPTIPTTAPTAPPAGPIKLYDDRDALIKRSEQSYRDVLQAYGSHDMAALSAHLGLAAIAENRGDWAAAEQQYNAVAGADRFPQSFRDEAKRRIETLPTLRQPPMIAQPATQPVDMLGPIAPNLLTPPTPSTPTTAPTTAPVAATQPIVIASPAATPAPAPTVPSTTQPATTQPAQ